MDLYDRARAAAQAGDYDTSYELLRKVVRDYQGTEGASLARFEMGFLGFYDRARAAAQAGDYDTSYELLRKVVRDSPGTLAASLAAHLLATLPPPAPAAAVAVRDFDGDGVADDLDRCPETPSGVSVDEQGCGGTLEEAKAKLSTGTYAYNPVTDMRSDSTYLIVLVLIPDSSITIKEAVQAATETITLARPSQPVDTVAIEQSLFSRRMSADLRGPDSWAIQRHGESGPRAVAQTDTTVWSWDVTPACERRGRLSLSLRCKDAVLTLTVSAWLDVDGIDTRAPWTPINRTIAVRVSAGQLAAGFIADNWQWLWTAVILPGLGLFWKRRKDQTIRILFLAANPSDTARLKLGEEVRAIDLALEKTKYRRRFVLLQHWAVHTSEVDDYLQRHNPHIVHFSGHGSPQGELILRNDSTREIEVESAQPRRESGPLAAHVLGRLFEALPGRVRCVVFNACYSEVQAQAVAAHIDCVVGMSKAIGDAAAIKFAEAFYQALGNGLSVKEAFDLGCLEIDAANLHEALTPRLIAVRVDPSSIRFAA